MMPSDRRDTQRLCDKTLDTFVSQKYHWKTLNPNQVFAMALELKHLRFIVKGLAETYKQMEAIKMSEKTEYTENTMDRDDPRYESEWDEKPKRVCPECMQPEGHHPHCPNS